MQKTTSVLNIKKSRLSATCSCPLPKPRRFLAASRPPRFQNSKCQCVFISLTATIWKIMVTVICQTCAIQTNREIGADVHKFTSETAKYVRYNHCKRLGLTRQQLPWVHCLDTHVLAKTCMTATRPFEHWWPTAKLTRQCPCQNRHQIASLSAHTPLISGVELHPWSFAPLNLMGSLFWPSALWYQQNLMRSKQSENNAKHMKATKHK